MLGLHSIDHGFAEGPPQHSTDGHDARRNQRQIADHGRNLRTHQMRHLVHECVHCDGGTEVLELDGHGRRRHGRLLGGHGPMQQLDQHKAQGVVHAREEAGPEGGHRQREHHELHPGGDGHDGTTAGGMAQHLAVFRHRAGDVVLARLGAALGHLRRQHGGVGGNERAQTAPLLTHVHQLCQQPHGAGPGVAGDQTVHQRANAQHPFAQLSQLEHQIHGNSMGVQMRIDRGCGTATGLEPFAKPLQRGLQL